MGGGGRLDGVNLNFELPRLLLEATVKVTYAAHLVPFVGLTQTKPFKMQRLIHTMIVAVSIQNLAQVVGKSAKPQNLPPLKGERYQI